MANHANNLDEKFYHFCHLHIERSRRDYFVFYKSELYMGEKGGPFNSITRLSILEHNTKL